MNIDISSMRNNAATASRLLGAMANEKRLMILCQLVEGERAVGELADLLDVRQSTVSQHLALLRRDGFVTARRDGQTLYYSLAGNEARAVLETLYGLYCAPGKRQGRGGENA
jgi:DNA-binding transcriptional ArsR family regulator